MAYDKNKDYAKAINDAKASGASKATIDRLTAERAEKISGEKLNNDGSRQGSVSVNRDGLTGQSGKMAEHLSSYLADAYASGNKTLIAYAEDKVNQFNSLASDQKYTAGEYRPVAIDNYKAMNLGASPDIASYRFDPRTGKETGNLNLKNQDYDVFRDARFNLMPALVEQQKRDALADYQRNTEQNGGTWTQEDTSWLLDKFTGQEAKLKDGYQANGYKVGSSASYVDPVVSQAVAKAVVDKVVRSNQPAPVQAVKPVNWNQVKAQEVAPVSVPASPWNAEKAFENKPRQALTAKSQYSAEVQRLIALAKSGDFGSADARRKLIMMGIPI